jgi:hypothetical protein
MRRSALLGPVICLIDPAASQLVWLCHKSGRSLKLKGNLRRFRVRLETKKLFDFNHLTINPTMFMTQS